MKNKHAEHLGMVITDMLQALVKDTMREQEQKRDSDVHGPMAGQKWSDHEDEKLVQEYVLVIKFMATAHSRTEGSIRSRLMKLIKEERIYL